VRSLRYAASFSIGYWWRLPPLTYRHHAVHNGSERKKERLNASTANPSHHANGNTLPGGRRTNTWDGQNRLTQCVKGSTTSTFTYGADGLRRRMVTGGNTTDYLLVGQSVVRTLLNGSVDKTYLHGARGPEYERDAAGNVRWYLYDGLGSVLGTVDGSGNIVSTRKYDVYGAVRASTGPSGTKHKWVGALGHPSEDETGLVYMRARYYDPTVGRFVSEDPAAHRNNWFAYADNSPVNKVDANGKNSQGINATMVGIALSAVIAGLAIGSLNAIHQWKKYRSVNPVEVLVVALVGTATGFLFFGSALAIAMVIGIGLGLGATLGALAFIVLAAVILQVGISLLIEGIEDKMEDGRQEIDEHTKKSAKSSRRRSIVYS